MEFQSEIYLTADLIVAWSLCSYVCTDPELETAYEQATRKALIQNISLGRERERESWKDAFHNNQCHWRMLSIKN